MKIIMWYVLLVAMVAIVHAVGLDVGDNASDNSDNDIVGLATSDNSDNSDSDTADLEISDNDNMSIGDFDMQDDQILGDLQIILDPSTIQVVDYVIAELFNNSIEFNASEVNISEIEIEPLVH